MRKKNWTDIVQITNNLLKYALQYIERPYRHGKTNLLIYQLKINLVVTIEILRPTYWQRGMLC